jgi:hypothetical protein
MEGGNVEARRRKTVNARRRFGQATLVALIALAVMAMPAGAGKKWCRADPIVRIDGNEIQILVEVQEEHVGAVSGPISIEIGTPANVARELVSTDAGFNGYGEVVTFTNTPNGNGKKGIPVKLKIKLPIDTKLVKNLKSVQIRVIITQDHSRAVIVKGNAKNGVSAAFYLKDVLAVQE